jgi:hypothetical protein
VQLEAQQSLHVDVILARLDGSEGANDLAPPPAAQNSDSAPLTKREKQLLDRIDRLERRLAALEAKDARGATPAAASTQPVMASPDPATAAAPQTGSVATPASAPAVIPEPLQAPEIPPAVAQEIEALKALNANESQEIEALKARIANDPPAAASEKKEVKTEPFSDWDWTWLNGNPRNKDVVFDSKYFTPEVRADLTYTYDSNHPKDNSMGGSSELFRSNEIQLEQFAIGGEFHWQNVRARLLTDWGMYATATPRNDASSSKGQWDLAGAYRGLAEAYGGYHLNVLDGVNIDAGLFPSYVGLFSFYNYDNWAYQPSYVSSNTPWFFTGIRVQIFPTPHLKFEPWFINGWQSLGSSNSRMGIGG